MSDTSGFFRESMDGVNHSARHRRSLWKWTSVLLVAAVGNLTAQSPAGYVNFEGKQTSPIRLSPDGSRLFAVNTPDARLSVFDLSRPSDPRLIAEIPVGLEPVSVNPRNNDEVWVVNEVSDSVSIVSVSKRIVIDTLPVKDEPADVVFASGKAFVSASRNNQIAVFDLRSHTLLTNLAVFGSNPRALTVSPDGTKVYAAFALSGNRTTLIPATNAPPQLTNGTPPMNPDLPPPPKAGLIVDATDPAWTNVIRYTMPDNDVVEIDAATLTVSRYFPRVGTVNLGLAVHPVSGDLYVANTDARNLIHFEPAVRAHAVDNRVARISIRDGRVDNFDLNPGIDYTKLPNPAALSTALAQPTALTFEPRGAFFYVAAFGSDRVAKLDPQGSILARIEIGPATGARVDPRNKRGPRGLALKASAKRLYVLNRIANSVSIVDTAADAVLKEIPVGTHDPTPPAVKAGRGFLYDAKLSGNGTFACAGCHVDGEMDLLAWDLGDPSGKLEEGPEFGPPLGTGLGHAAFHPMKGPMTTQTLRGLKDIDPLHWRGDRTNFLHFNIAFPGVMGGPALSAGDLAAFREFIESMAFEPNPNQNLDRSLPTSLAGGNPVAGLNAFRLTTAAPGFTCGVCHPRPPGNGTLRGIVSHEIWPESQDFKVPHLREVYQKNLFNNAPGASSVAGFGFSNDGEFATLQQFLSQSFFSGIRGNDTAKNNLAAFLLCFDTGTAPAVGFTRTATAANVGSLTNDWSLLENQAAVTNIDLVAQGTIDGRLHGLMFQPAAGNYLADSTNLPAFTREQLTAKIRNGDTLSFMGVPVGTGARAGMDRDLDGVRDGDAQKP